MQFGSDNNVNTLAVSAGQITGSSGASLSSETVQFQGFQQQEELTKIGELLRETREAKKVSLDAVAADLNIFSRHLARLEQGKQPDIADAYIRGYLKVYSAYLQLDAGKILTRYTLATAKPEPVDVEKPESTAAASQSSAQLFVRSLKASINDIARYVAYGVRSNLSVAAPALLLAVVGFTYYSIDVQRITSEELILSDTQVQEPDKLGVLASEVMLSSQESNVAAVDMDGADDNEAPQAIAATAVQQGNVQGLLTVGAVSEVPARTTVPGSLLEDAFEPVGPGAVEMISQIPQSDRLVITVYEDSWIDVRDDTGARLYRNLARAGRRIDVSGVLPFSLHVGNAPGLELRLNGEPVAIEGYRADNSARLTVAAN